MATGSACRHRRQREASHEIVVRRSSRPQRRRNPWGATRLCVRMNLHESGGDRMKTRQSALVTVVLGALLLGQNAFGASSHTRTPTAASVVAAAEAKAASANKNVLVIFHASWCG